MAPTQIHHGGEVDDVAFHAEHRIDDNEGAPPRRTL